MSLDHERMGQVLGNLLSNAIKYTPEGGRVWLSANSDDLEVRIIVADNGPGIVLEEQEKVFEPFFRSQQQRRFPQGLGLGLTIARDIAEAHGGTLEFEGEPDSGSRFVVHLPQEG
jgi:signal transduction histidine kinase